jgi:predicted AAA+ superfamily ATPase
MSSFSRPVLTKLIQRMAEPRRFLQVLAGPRQAGKTTLARQLMKAYGDRSFYATADSMSRAPLRSPERSRASGRSSWKIPSLPSMRSPGWRCGAPRVFPS